MFVCLYVNDLLITGINEDEISMFKRDMMTEFDMSDLDKLSYFLGMEFHTTEKGIFMGQKKYAADISLTWLTAIQFLHLLKLGQD